MARSGGLRSVVRSLSARTPAADPVAGSEPTKLMVLVGAASPGQGDREDPAWTRVRLDGLGALPARDRWDEVAVVAESIAELRGVLPWLELAGRSKLVTMSVRATDRAGRLRSPTSIGRHAVEECRLQSADGGTGATALRVRVSNAVAVVDVARAALTAPPSGGRAGPGSGLRLAVTSVEAGWWAAGDPAARMLSAGTELQDANGVPAFDLLIGTGARTGSDRELPRITLDEGLALPPVDTVVCSPVGFGPAGAVHGELSPTDTGTWEIRVAGAAPVTTDSTTGLTENHVQALRPLRFVRVTPQASGADPRGLGRLLSQLCCAGVPVSAPHLPAPLLDALGPDLAERLRTLEPAALADPVTRDAWSLRTRRAALARFTGSGYWAARTPHVGRALLPPPSVSVLLATRRPPLLTFALAQIARQDWPDLEVVVVLHGGSAEDPTVRSAVDAFPRPISAIGAAPGLSFGAALNAGLARCSGRLVTKMDDDDWYGPHHLSDLVQAHAYSGATLVGAAGYYVYLSQSDVTVRFTSRPTESPNRWVVGATNLLATADLVSVGGWRSLPFGEDATLYRAVQAAGGSIYGTHDLGFTYFRGRDHTWSPPDGDAKWLDERYPREAGFRPPPEVHPLPHPLMAGEAG